MEGLVYRGKFALQILLGAGWRNRTSLEALWVEEIQAKSVD